MPAPLQIIGDPNYTMAELPHGDAIGVINDPLPEPCEFDEPQTPEPTLSVQQNQPSGQWEPSDGTPGKAAEPQPNRRFEAVNTVIGGVKLSVHCF